MIPSSNPHKVVGALSRCWTLASPSDWHQQSLQFQSRECSTTLYPTCAYSCPVQCGQWSLPSFSPSHYRLCRPSRCRCDKGCCNEETAAVHRLRYKLHFGKSTSSNKMPMYGFLNISWSWSTSFKLIRNTVDLFSNYTPPTILFWDSKWNNQLQSCLV